MGGLTWAAVDQIGATDCEAIGGGFLAQPANSLSSLAYVVVGLWFLRRTKSYGGDTATSAAFWLAVVAVGLGSVAFHGPMFAGARLLHDLSIAAVLAVVAAHSLGRLRSWREERVLAVAGTIAAATAVTAVLSVGIGAALTTGLAAVAVGLEVYRYRSERWNRVAGYRRRMSWGVAAVVGAGIVNVLSRTEGPLCDPSSLFQGHALWHVLTAAGLGVYGLVAFSEHEPLPGPDPD